MIVLKREIETNVLKIVIEYVEKDIISKICIERRNYIICINRLNIY